METEKSKKKPGSGSFCIPRAAVEALLNNGATAYEICAYLTLARFTDESGRYSPASISAVNDATGARKTRGGPIDRSIQRLKTIRAKKVGRVSNGRSGKSHAWIEQAADLGPILIDRDTWHRDTGEVLPDGPTERGRIRYVLPDFGEPLADRVWFGNNLISGVGEFDKPLKALKNAGDVAARLLLSMYAANDMELWGGVRPVGDGRGPWEHYEPVAKDENIYGGARLIREKAQGTVGTLDKRVSPAGNGWDDYFVALRALRTAGFVYEVVMVLNRNRVPSKFAGGEEYGHIPADAEPLYELDARSSHGYKPVGEHGIGGATARTAGEMGRSVATEGGQFDGTYAAFVPAGYPAMIAGIYRLRFRVSNNKNAGVRGTWARIHENNRDAFSLLQSIRAAHKMAPLDTPKDLERPSSTGTEASAETGGLAGDGSDGWIDFWSGYPRKINREQALEVWEGLSREDRQKALAALPLHLEEWRATDTEDRFIPFPAKWLAGGRFEDELPER